MNRFRILSLTPVAAAVGFAVLGAPTYAATLNSGTAKLVSAERMAADVAADANAFTTIPAVVIDLGSDLYSNGDKVTIAVAGATVFSGSNLTVTCADNVVTGPITLTLDPAATSGGNIVFTVGGRNATPVYDNTNGKRCTLLADSIKVLSSSLTSPTNVTINWTAATAAGVVYDRLASTSAVVQPGAAAPHRILSSVRQFSEANLLTRSSITNENSGPAAADPTFIGGATQSLARAGFSSFSSCVSATTGASTVTSCNKQSFTWTTRNAHGSDGELSAVGDSLLISGDGNLVLRTTLTGDFSWLDDDANGCTLDDVSKGAGRLTYEVTTSADEAVGAIAADCQSITLTVGQADGSVQDRVHTVNFLVRGYDNSNPRTLDSVAGRTLPATTYSRSTVVEQQVGTTPTVTAATGRATLSGSGGGFSVPSTAAGTTTINYLPFGSGISHIIYAANTSSTLTATATVSARNASGVECAAGNFGAISVGPRSTAALANQITQGINACYGAGTDQRVYIVLTWTNTKPAVTAIYNANNNRVSVAAN